MVCPLPAALRVLQPGDRTNLSPSPSPPRGGELLSLIGAVPSFPPRGGDLLSFIAAVPSFRPRGGAAFSLRGESLLPAAGRSAAFSLTSESLLPRRGEGRHFTSQKRFPLPAAGRGGRGVRLAGRQDAARRAKTVTRTAGCSPPLSCFAALSISAPVPCAATPRGVGQWTYALMCPDPRIPGGKLPISKAQHDRFLSAFLSAFCRDQTGRICALIEASGSDKDRTGRSVTEPSTGEPRHEAARPQPVASEG